MNAMRKQGWALRLAIIFSTALMLGSCGSGGVSADSNPEIPLSLSPAVVTVYSGVPVTFTIAGGGLRGPYQLSSNNPALLAVPTTPLQATQFTVTPATVAANTNVTITLQDQAGKTATSVSTVTPNIVSSDLTIKGTAPDSLGITNCQQTGTVCAGQPGLVTVSIAQNGAPARGRTVRFDVIQGAFRFPIDVAQTQFATSVTVTSDEAGKAVAILRADAGAPFQNAVIRATDVTSGAFLTSTFFIRQATVAGAEFSTVPAGWSVTGAYLNVCPAGSVDFLIFGGTPPYTIRSSAQDFAPAFPSVTATENPSRFVINYRQVACDAVGYEVIYTVTDATGLTILPKLTVKPGTTAAPAPAPVLTLSTNLITLSCGQQAQVLATVTNPTTPPATITTAITTPMNPANTVTAVVNQATGVITITRTTTGGPYTAASSPVQIVIGAGSAAPQTLSVVLGPSTVANQCP